MSDEGLSEVGGGHDGYDGYGEPTADDVGMTRRGGTDEAGDRAGGYNGYGGYVEPDASSASDVRLHLAAPSDARRTLTLETPSGALHDGYVAVT